MSDKEDPPIDINLCFICTPPLMIPVSDRAKEKMNLPEGVGSAIMLEDLDAIGTLGLLCDNDWILGNQDEPPESKLIMLMSTKVLH